MKESLFANLFILREAIKGKEEKLDEIDKQKEPIINELTKLKEELSQVQETILEDMVSKDVKTYTYQDKNVTAATRRTLGIVDEGKVMSFIESKAGKIGKVVGFAAKEIKEKSFMKVLNKPFVKEIADSWLKVEGSPMQGTELKETTYLTIK